MRRTGFRLFSNFDDAWLEEGLPRSVLARLSAAFDDRGGGVGDSLGGGCMDLVLADLFARSAAVLRFTGFRLLVDLADGDPRAKLDEDSPVLPVPFTQEDLCDFRSRGMFVPVLSLEAVRPVSLGFLNLPANLILLPGTFPFASVPAFDLLLGIVSPLERRSLADVCSVSRVDGLSEGTDSFFLRR